MNEEAGQKEIQSVQVEEKKTPSSLMLEPFMQRDEKFKEMLIGNGIKGVVLKGHTCNL